MHHQVMGLQQLNKMIINEFYLYKEGDVPLYGSQFILNTHRLVILMPKYKCN